MSRWSNWDTGQVGLVVLCRGGLVGQVQRREFWRGGWDDFLSVLAPKAKVRYAL